jgi:hypothetical protein
MDKQEAEMLHREIYPHAMRNPNSNEYKAAVIQEYSRDMPAEEVPYEVREILSPSGTVGGSTKSRGNIFDRLSAGV